MTRSELPHTVSSHPVLSLDIILNAPCAAEEPCIAGDLLQGTLQLSAPSNRIALGEIGVELVVEAGELGDIREADRTSQRARVSYRSQRPWTWFSRLVR